MKVYIICNGCDRRLLDSEQLRNYFTQNGATIVKDPAVADYIIFNTCSFSQIQEDTCMRLIKEYSGYNGELMIVGCLPALSKEKLEGVFKGRCLHTQNLDQIGEYFPDFKIPFSEISDAGQLHKDLTLWQKFWAKFDWSINFFYICLVALRFKIKRYNTPLHRGIRKGGYLRISRGCFDKCSYCAIPKAIGPLKSKTIEECVSDYKKLLEQKHKVIILTADNVGSYGIDVKTNFGELLQALDEVTPAGEVEWIIGEFHPIWVIKYHKELAKYIEKQRIKELMVPIQSGSERILKLMKRDPRVTEVEKILKDFKIMKPELMLNTDLIVGFPSEQMEEFEQGIRFVENVGFDQVQLFKYSDRKGTRASELSDKVSQKEVLKRLKWAMKRLDKANIGYLYQ